MKAQAIVLAGFTQLTRSRQATWPRQLVDRALTSFTMLTAPLYSVLKWIALGAAAALVAKLFEEFVTSGFSPPVWWEVVGRSIIQYRIPIALALGLFSVLFLSAWVGRRRKEALKRLRNAFRLCKPAEQLGLADLGFREASPQEPQRVETHQEERPFFGTYFSRKALEESESPDADPALSHEFTEKELEGLLRENKGFLLIGLPYSGKTITLFHILHRMKGYVVLSPSDSQPVPTEDIFALLRRQKVVILLDDIATYAERNYDIEMFSIRMRAVTKGCFGVAGTCRDAGDIAMVMTGHGNHVTNFCEALPKLRLHPMTRKEMVALAQTAGRTITVAEARLFPEPGNVTMMDRTQAMQERFRALMEPEKDALRAMKLLDAGGVSITIPRIHSVLTDVLRRGVEREALHNTLRKLWDEFFLREQPDREKVRPHFGYLTYSVSYQEGPDLENAFLSILARPLEKARDVQALLQIASSFRRRGDFLGVVQACDSVLQIEPQHADAYLHRGHSLARLGKLEEALEANKRALDIRPCAEVYMSRGYILSRLGNLPGALDALDKALELRPDLDDAHTNRAIVLARLGRFSEAVEEYKGALGIKPRSSYAYLNLGITLAREDFFSESLEAYDQALRIRPDYPEAYLNRGHTFARMGRFEDALKEHDHAIKVRHDYAEAHQYRGETLANLDRLVETEESLTRAIDIKPDYALAYSNRARTRARMGPEYKKAAYNDWQTALDLGFVPPQEDLSLGTTLASVGSFTQAITCFDHAIDSYPESAEAYYQRGRTFVCLNRHDAALLDFDKVIELCPDHAGAQCARGPALANLEGRYREALESSTTAVKLHPEFAPAHLSHGYVLTRGKGYDKARLEWALKAYDEAVRIRPNYPEAHRERGFILGQLGFDEEALKAFDQAIELRPTYVEALFGKARSLCFLVRSDPKRFPPDRCFEEVMELLRRAIEIDATIISRLTKDRSAFRPLRAHPDYGSRFRSLIWGELLGKKDKPGASPVSS